MTMDSLVQGDTEFAFDLYGKLKATQGNLFFSPYSISTALAMTYAGARGTTALQMAQALHFSLDQEQLHPAFASLKANLDAVEAKGEIRLRIANALWPQTGYPLLEEFLDLAREYYGALITPLDYGDAEAARATINTWIEDKTEGKIKNLIPPGVLDALTRLVLSNAIYFKGNWARQFNQQLTRDAPFWPTPDVQVTVPMMTQQQRFRYAESDGLQILELPYAGDDLSMIVLLPGKIDGLAQLEAALTVDNLEKWTGHLWNREVRVFLPRLKMTSQFRLKDALASMGMRDAFSLEKADFSGMDGIGWLYISAALHKAFIEVNEEGTEAAAATAVVIGLRAQVEPPPTFRADHPFMFLIRENSTGSILFMGRVADPASEAG